LKAFLAKSFSSGILIGLGVALLFLHISTLILHKPIPYYWHHILPASYVLLLLLGIRKPVHDSLLAINSDIKPLLYVIEWFIIFAALSVYASVRYLKESHFVIISVFISAAVVSIGWWVQSIIAAARQRRQHTVNTIIQTRVSDVYQTKLSEYNKLFSSSDIYINKELARNFARYRNLNNLDIKNLDLVDLNKALYGAMYLINFFEFISAGIQKRDLDNTLLRDCFEDVVKNLEKKCFHLIWYYRERSGVFKEFEHLCDSWLGRKSLLGMARRNERVDKAILGKAFPKKCRFKKSG
jgi:hypothetical protein